MSDHFMINLIQYYIILDNQNLVGRESTLFSLYYLSVFDDSVGLKLKEFRNKIKDFEKRSKVT